MQNIPDNIYVQKHLYVRLTHHNLIAPPTDSIRRNGFYYVPLSSHSKLKNQIKPKQK